jgi:diguanylate cyclase (GGDEF)-like protein/PAS domain S-box-containing protein
VRLSHAPRVMSYDATESDSPRNRIFDVVLKAIPEAAVVTDATGRIVQANEAMAILFGHTIEDLLSLHVDDLLSAQHRTSACTQRESLTSNPDGRANAASQDLMACTREGHEIAVAVRLTLVHLNGNRYIVTAFQNLTRERELEQCVADYEGQLHAINVLSSDWYWRQDADLRFTYISPRGLHTPLADAQDGLGKTRFEMPYEYESEARRKEHEQTVAQRKPFRNLLMHNPENDRYAEVSGEPLFDARGEFSGYHGVARDVTEEKRAQRALSRGEARFRALAAMSSDWFWEQDENLRYSYLSPTGPANASTPIDDFLGHTRFELDLVWESEAAKQRHAETLKARLPFRDLLLRTLSGDQYLNVSGEPVFDNDGTFKGYQGVTNDVTARKLAEAEVLWLATHDALTGLPNRPLLVDRLERAIARASRNNQYVAVLFLDMDRFKTLNDTFGHGGGDEFLRTVSARLGGVLRRSDTLARLGGDEFVVVLESPHGDANTEAEAIANKMLGVLAETVELNGVAFQTSASIGISMYPGNGADTETLLHHADLAMYEAKDAGRGCVRFYADAMNHRVAQRATLDRELRDALEQGQFEPYFHPQHDILTGKVHGAEVLLRWNHPVRGLVAPGEFIPAAEESGLILPIGQFVLERAFAAIKDWLSRGIVPPRLAVNVSSRQLQDGDTLVNQARTLLETSGVPHGLIEFEITESILIQSGDDASMNVLQTLGELGIRLAIDDFGTGYSSLSYLKRLPVHAIKIDRAFVSDLTNNEESAAIVRAVVGLAHNIKLEVVSEGVETEEQLEMLRHMGCDSYQGFLREEPMPQHEFEKRLLGLHGAEDSQTPRNIRIATR